MSRRIKLLAKDLDVPVILLSQLSRSAEQRNEKPQLHDLRDSGSIEQDADIVLFLYKEKGQDPQNEIIELIVAKYRNGKQGSLAFRWDGRFFKFDPQSEDALDKIVVYGKDGQATVVGRAADAKNNSTAAASTVKVQAQPVPAPTYPVTNAEPENVSGGGLTITEDAPPPQEVKPEETPF